MRFSMKPALNQVFFPCRIIAHVLNLPQPSTGTLAGSNFGRFSCFDCTKKLRNEAILDCRYPVGARTGGCDSGLNTFSD